MKKKIVCLCLALLLTVALLLSLAGCAVNNYYTVRLWYGMVRDRTIRPLRVTITPIGEDGGGTYTATGESEIDFFLDRLLQQATEFGRFYHTDASHRWGEDYLEIKIYGEDPDGETVELSGFISKDNVFYITAGDITVSFEYTVGYEDFYGIYLDFITGRIM